MKHSFAIAAALAALFAAAGGASAEDWGPFPVKIPKGDTESVGQFVPLKAGEKRWKLCALVPRVKDSYWIAADYGLIEEAKRLGVDIAVFEAGGYGNLPRQVNQFDDCLSSKADAILVAPISEAGLAGSFAKAKAANVPTIAFINPVSEAPVAGKIFTQMKTKGVEAGRFLVKTMTPGGPGYQVVGFPGA
jgi:periplasmic protein TorT